MKNKKKMLRVTAISLFYELLAVAMNTMSITYVRIVNPIWQKAWTVSFFSLFG